MTKNRTPQPCPVPDCVKLANNGWSVCAMHYYRMRRTGTYADPVRPVPQHKVDPITGYVRTSVSVDHILLTGSKPGRRGIHVHRLVLFNEIGYGPHRCHYCETHINWRSKLEVDHVDRVKTNNDPSNLVQACGPCNTRRGIHRNQFSKPLADQIEAA